MTLDIYESLTESIEAKLDAADIQAEEISERLSHDDVFDAARAHIKEKQTRREETSIKFYAKPRYQPGYIPPH